MRIMLFLSMIVLSLFGLGCVSVQVQELLLLFGNVYCIVEQVFGVYECGDYLQVYCMVIEVVCLCFDVVCLCLLQIYVVQKFGCFDEVCCLVQWVIVDGLCDLVLFGLVVVVLVCGVFISGGCLFVVVWLSVFEQVYQCVFVLVMQVYEVYNNDCMDEVVIKVEQVFCQQLQQGVWVILWVVLLEVQQQLEQVDVVVVMVIQLGVFNVGDLQVKCVVLGCQCVVKLVQEGYQVLIVQDFNVVIGYVWEVVVCVLDVVFYWLLLMIV